MGKNFKQELYHLSRCWLVLLVLVLLFAGSTVISAKEVPGVWNYTRVTHPYLSLYDEAQYSREFEYSLKRHSLEEIKEDQGMDSPEVESLEDMYAMYQRACYIRLMWYTAGLALLAAVLPPVLIRASLNSGIPGLCARLCGSPRRAALAKLAVFYLASGLISLSSTLFLASIYASTAMAQLGFGYCLRCVIQRLLLDWAVLSIPVYIAFLCRSTVLTALLDLVYGCLSCWVSILAAGRETVLFIPFPAFLHGLRSLWQPGASPLWLGLSALVSLAYIAFFGWLSVRRFERQNDPFS